MTALAWIIIAAWIFLLLPDGKSFDLRKDVNWHSPKPYVRIVMNSASLALAIWVAA